MAMLPSQPPAPAIRLRLGDVARIAGAPPETIRSRIKSGIFDLDDAPGWRSFTVAKAALIALHAQVKADTGDDALAAALAEEMAPRLAALDAVPAGAPEALREAVAADLFAVCARDRSGRWTIEVAEGPFAVDAAIARRCAESYDRQPIFLTLNAGAILRSIAARLLERPAAVAAPSEVTSRSRRHA